MDPCIASIRLRVIKPVSYLRNIGMNIYTNEIPYDPELHNVVLFSKSFGAEALSIAKIAKAKGKIIIYDICDNVFAGKKSYKAARRSAAIEEMLNLADHVVFTTEVLRQQIMERIPIGLVNTSIIPDGLDSFSADGHSYDDRAEKSLSRLSDFLVRHKGALRCIWFGKSQGRKSGIAHIQHAVRELEIFSRQHPVTLTVVSNHSLRYFMHSRGWRIPHHYEHWNSASFGQILSMHDVAVIPIEQNDYTIGKTINRPATAIMAGLGVVADSIDAYEELRAYIPLDNWQSGLSHYCQTPPLQDPALIAAREYLQSRFGNDIIGSNWADLLIKFHEN